MTEKIEKLKVVSELNRVRILLMLMQRSLCVCEITSILGLSTATVSNHLSYIRDNGFIKIEKEGKWINYSINNQISNQIVKDILDLLPLWFGNEEIIQKDLLKVKQADRYEITYSKKKLVS